jgi:hypothetical protein
MRTAPRYILSTVPGLRRVLAMACAAGCAAEAPHLVKTASAPKVPAWVVKVPQSDDALYFSGARDAASSLEEGTDAAAQSARAHAAEFIGVELSAEHKDVQSTEIATNRVTDTVKSRTAALLRSAEVAEVYYEKWSRRTGQTTIDLFDVWVLVRLPRREIDTERQRQITEQARIAAAALARMREGVAEEKAGHVLAALARYRDAVSNVRPLPASVDTGDPQVRTSGQLVTLAEDALRKAQVKARRALLVAPEWAASGVARGLSAKGFSAVTMHDGDERAALEKARAEAMPWVVVVKGTTTPIGPVFSQVAATASLDVRALESGSGDVVVSVQKQTKAVDRTVEAARQAAANDAGASLGAEIAAALAAREGQGSSTR